jgi:hypothetical protein
MKLNPKLIGGSRDGETVDAGHRINGVWWPSVMYFSTKITVEEAKGLTISPTVLWRIPDDVYEFDGTNYIFKERIDYKPKELA